MFTLSQSVTRLLLLFRSLVQKAQRGLGVMKSQCRAQKTMTISARDRASRVARVTWDVAVVHCTWPFAGLYSLPRVGVCRLAKRAIAYCLLRLSVILNPLTQSLPLPALSYVDKIFCMASPHRLCNYPFSCSVRCTRLYAEAAYAELEGVSEMPLASPTAT